jgi:4-hydroxyphenylpyruvate dioxygenase
MATVCLSGLLEDKLQAIAAAGFPSVQIAESDLLCCALSPREIGQLAARLNLTIDAYIAVLDGEGVTTQQFRQVQARAARLFAVMDGLGAKTLILPANVQADASGDPASAASQLRLLAERAAALGLRIAYAALPWATHVRRLEDAWSLVQTADHPALGLCLNAYHVIAADSAVSGIAGARIFAVQLNDAPRIDAAGRRWNWLAGCFPGQGDLDVGGFLRAVLATGYDGPLALDVRNDEFQGASSFGVAEDGHRALLLLEEQVGAAGFHPPPPPAICGVSFLEFAASHTMSGGLQAWMERFGFRTLGRHRSKQVFLLRNGAVNLVINAEPGSFAESFFYVHGSSVCALGLRTADAERAMARAMAFGCKQFVGRVGPNELEIPAVRMLDGSLIYFVGDAMESHGLYDIEFAIDPARQTAEPGLTAVDHIAFSLPSGQLEAWALFYRAVAGFAVDPTWILSDPNGVVKSRAVSSPDGAVRLPLNVSNGRRTGTARAVNRQGGAGVNHVAFASDDIFRTVAQLRASGARLLIIPRNYYDELTIRFGLEKDYVAALAEANILYDRVDSGEFLHVYSEPFEDRFFFEFVQRKGGYDAYGAPNAPIRLAAAARLEREREQQSQL